MLYFIRIVNTTVTGVGHGNLYKSNVQRFCTITMIIPKT